MADELGDKLVCFASGGCANAAYHAVERVLAPMLQLHAFLKIADNDGEITIPGSSSDSNHCDWIDVLEYDHSLVQPVAGVTDSGSAFTGEKARHEAFRIKKALDKSTPKLAVACADARNIGNVTLEICETSDSANPVLRIELNVCRVFSFAPSGSGVEHATTGSTPGGMGVEEVRFTYGKITWTYQPDNISAFWDISAGRGG